MDIQNKYKLLQDSLRKLESVVVAYSGGVDSTFLLKASVDTLGAGKVLACIGVSPSLAQSQHDQAVKYAKLIGAQLREVSVDELEDESYSANRADRCFHCKSYLYRALHKVGQENGYAHLVCGSNYDDQDDYRPGNRAALKLGVHSPLMDAQLSKAEIRSLSKEADLPTADLPATPCLASRMSYGLEITSQRLSQVEQAEDFLRSLGFREFRVRHHDAIARIEVLPQDLTRILEPNWRQTILDQLKSFGFQYVTVDLQGFRSGSMNEALSPEQKKRFK
jgi:pyridinium-3,5-biscarboxylic acid mononucleotide sulfurtransferase